MFPDIAQHPAYLPAQSAQWCDQLASQTGKYAYTWAYVHEGTSAEEVFTEELRHLMGGRVLDVGCGHGEYTNGWADRTEEIVGYDRTEGFIHTAEMTRRPNVRYVIGTTRDGLPFADDYFDLAYTKKGPTSWYREGNRVVRPGGKLLMLHPGDGDGEGGELGLVFPGLFPEPVKGTPTLEVIMERLSVSGLADIGIRRLRETGWIPTPEDVLEMRCFGQTAAFKQYVRETCFSAIRNLFERHAEREGLRLTGFYYLIRATAN